MLDFSGPQGPELDGTGLPGLQMEMNPMNMHSNVTATSATIAADTRWLATWCPCPAAVRARLFDWTADLLVDPAKAWAMPTVQRAVEDLIILSHANAGFSLAATPRYYRGRPAIEITDLGGFFAAQQTIRDILIAAPLCSAHRSELMQHILTVVDRHMARLEELLPRA